MNGKAILEGDPVPFPRVSPKGRVKLPAPVVLKNVTRDRLVRFAYKGLSIRVVLGARIRSGITARGGG